MDRQDDPVRLDGGNADKHLLLEICSPPFFRSGDQRVLPPVPAVDDHEQDGFHGRRREPMEISTDQFPQPGLFAKPLPGGLEQGATHLLHLVDKEGQHHQLGKHRAQMLLAQAIIVAQIVALVLQRVEHLVFNPPPGSAAPHDLNDVGRGERDVGHPREPHADCLHPIFLDHLPVFEKVDLEILVALVQGHGVDETKAVVLVRILRVDHDVVGHLAALIRLVDPPEQKGVIPGFGREEIAQVVGHQVADTRCMGTQPILQE